MRPHITPLRHLIDIWVGALRSGHFKQAQHTLSDGEGLCCLGVLAMVAPEEWGLTLTDINDREAGYDHRLKVTYRGSSQFQILPRSFWTDSGLEELIGPQDDLTNPNDNGATFNELANIIEKYARERCED